MDPFPRVIELSDDDEDYSDGSVYDFERNFLANDSEIETDDEPLDVGQDNGTRPSGRRNLLDGYQSCLGDVLEVFPAISHDYVQKLFSKENENLGVNAGQEITVAPRLIENILDHGVYPKEKDRIRELKRKRTDKDNDEEEAAKWKYMDLRDDPAEYARVAYVYSTPLRFPKLSVSSMLY